MPSRLISPFIPQKNEGIESIKMHRKGLMQVDIIYFNACPPLFTVNAMSAVDK
jgi:hypothetical protein